MDVLDEPSLAVLVHELKSGVKRSVLVPLAMEQHPKSLTLRLISYCSGSVFTASISSVTAPNHTGFGVFHVPVLLIKVTKDGSSGAEIGVVSVGVIGIDFVVVSEIGVGVVGMDCDAAPRPPAICT